MTDANELEPRVAALEARVDEVAAESAAVRELAAGTDREVSDLQVELRVHKSLIQALQKTQSQTLARVRGLESRMEAGFAEMRGDMGTGFAMMAAGFEALHDRLDQIERPG